jgi:hypothetical protein
MALLNGAGNAPASVPTGVSSNENAGLSVDAKKAKKKESTKRFYERKAAAAQTKYQEALALRDELVKAGYMDKLSADAKTFVLSLCKDPAERAIVSGFGGPSVFVTIYGDQAKVGDRLTLADIFEKTGKGKSTMDVWLKRWLDKGIEVKFEVNKDKLSLSTYTIMKLPAA